MNANFIYTHTTAVCNNLLQTASDEYIKKMNSTAKNYDFSKKKPIYQKTKLSITNEIAGRNFEMTESYIEERHRIIVKEIWNYLGLN